MRCGEMGGAKTRVRDLPRVKSGEDATMHILTRPGHPFLLPTYAKSMKPLYGSVASRRTRTF